MCCCPQVSEETALASVSFSSSAFAARAATFAEMVWMTAVVKDDHRPQSCTKSGAAIDTAASLDVVAAELALVPTDNEPAEG